MAKFIKKIMDYIGFDSEEEYDDEFVETDSYVPEKEEIDYRPKKGKVVNINTTTQLKVVVVTPDSYDEARDIADHLKQKKPVVINLENVERDVARRIVDFLSGSVFALDGSIQKISSGIFLIAPYNVGIMGDFKDELRSKGVFQWNY